MKSWVLELGLKLASPAKLQWGDSTAVEALTVDAINFTYKPQRSVTPSASLTSIIRSHNNQGSGTYKPAEQQVRCRERLFPAKRRVFITNHTTIHFIPDISKRLPNAPLRMPTQIKPIMPANHEQLVNICSKKNVEQSEQIALCIASCLSPVLGLIILSVIGAVLIADPVVALETTVPDGQGAQPAEEGDAAEDAPGESLALGMDVDGEGEQPAGHEGPDASAGCGQRLSHAVQGAEGAVVRGAVCDLSR